MNLEEYLTLVAEFDTLWGKIESDTNRSRMEELLTMMLTYENASSENQIPILANKASI